MPLGASFCRMLRWKLPNAEAPGSWPIRKFQLLSKYVPVSELLYGTNQFQIWNASYRACDTSPRTQKPAWAGVVSAFASARSCVGFCGGEVMPAALNIAVL